MLDFAELYTLTRNLSVLLVEDHEEILQTTAEILENYFNSIDIAHNGVEALELYMQYHEKGGKFYDLIITDIEMPLKNGVELVKDIKSLHQTQQIIVLSAHDESHYLLDLINLGISYYIPKPIEMESLYQALYRVTHDDGCFQNQTRKCFLDDDFVYDLSKKRLFYQDREIKFTKHESLLLDILMQKFDQVCSTEDIITYFDSMNVHITAENIRYHISKLRKKLPPDTIESLYAVGYKLKPVRQLSEV